MTNRSPGQAAEAVQRMVDSSRHRGPDGAGRVVIPLRGETGHLVLGHTRLSIIDLSERSNQPMCDEATGSFLVYNGEIYNFRELRRQLEGCGAAFTTQGDTEVLLKALLHWGQGALQRLEGMFACAFWDARKQMLMLARDPLGIKPLYYLRKPGTFLFGSELRTLRASGLHPFALDREGIASYLNYGAVISPGTALKGVKELTPGHALSLGQPADQGSEVEYWSLARYVTSPRTVPARQFTDAVEFIRPRLASAVKSHLVSDVPIGVSLSGGVDSNLIARLAAREQQDNLVLLTVGFDEEDFSEVREAAEVARELQLRHDVVHISNETFRNLLPGALAAMDQPTANGINTYVISSGAASVGLKVLLTGVGGDELFGGYTTFRKVSRLYRHQRLARAAAGVLGRLGGNAVQWEKVRGARGLRSLGDAYLLQRSIRWDQWKHGAFPEEHGVITELSRRWEGIESCGDDFTAIACMEMSFYLRNQLLRDSDVASMAHSVEIRVPFLDLQLVEAALQVQGSNQHGLSGGKRITRFILAQLGNGRGAKRKKKGFVFPWAHWMHGPLRQQIADTLLDRTLYQSLALDYRYGEHALQAFDKRDPLVSWAEIWSLFVLLDWQGRYRYADVAD